ncbi:MAG: hypothetical protein ACLTDM_15175 [Clostridium butyricum]
MKIETLKERIKKAEIRLEKSKQTLERHNKTLEKKAKALTDKGIDLNNYDRCNYRDRNDLYWDLCSYEDKLDDMKNTAKKIREIEFSLAKYKEQLEKQLATDNEINSIIPPVLDKFMENWKQKMYDYFIEEAKEYIEITTKDYEITRDELCSLMKEKYDRKQRGYINVRRYSDKQIDEILKSLEMGTLWASDINIIKSDIRDKYIREYKNSAFLHHANIIMVESIIDYDTIDTNKLNKILDEEVEQRKKDFIKRIKMVIGDIKDLKGLSIGLNGEINGVAKGVECDAKVQTIGAGGYNIQQYHYRVLVNAIEQR